MSEQERQDPVFAEQVREPGEAASAEAGVVAGPSVGERIRKGREAAGLSEADLAQPLNLDLRVIELVERDELDAVPGRPYILAYLRSWATQLGIDGDALVAQYNAQRAPGSGAVQGGIHPTLDVMEPRGGGVGGRLLGWLVILVVIVVAILGLSRLDPEQIQSWWSDMTGKPAESQSQPASEPGDAERPAIEGALEKPPAPPTGDDTATGSSSAEASTAGLPTQRLAAIESAPQPVESETQATEPAQAAESSESAGSAEPASASPVLLLRATQADSWVEVRDGKGERLMYDVLAAGEERSFTDAVGPFSLVLGQPEGLEVEYRGEPVELDAASESTGVLRTTVGNS
ncbi:DUF4115 domain-containing protein [Guyparkeria hydrothermalis]|uniref:helix-turn-helix domain-containing protein n=1 Tax=Guyparkeria hydrothermalis TaxID=923 RepID=UPI002020B3B0|nr:helix-turn-helix domain-containing protein [Guyparkeria hydrothermalis]MCL7745047.1 DUF4115 domain-containing protein [Guyparkeria hydrothermalis]